MRGEGNEGEKGIRGRREWGGEGKGKDRMNQSSLTILISKQSEVACSLVKDAQQCHYEIIHT